MHPGLPASAPFSLAILGSLLILAAAAPSTHISRIGRRDGFSSTSSCDKIWSNNPGGWKYDVTIRNKNSTECGVLGETLHSYLNQYCEDVTDPSVQPLPSGYYEQFLANPLAQQNYDCVEKAILAAEHQNVTCTKLPSLGY